MAGNEDWRKNADTHKMSPEDVKRAGVDASKRPPGHNPGGILHQRRKLPYNPATMALIGFAIAGSIFYFTLYTKRKTEASARDVARVSTGAADPQDTRPRK
ncbi:hypothetical protein ACH5RR_039397 [Cinchona calisaya]|uniref:Transmembrane protein n=1 Tax=Cinchona calisaya TaxID=153742 RepID=A0ABD2Y1L3_9GENT